MQPPRSAAKKYGRNFFQPDHHPSPASQGFRGGHAANIRALPDEPGPSPKSKMKHHNHWRYERVTNRMSRRAEAALGYLMALAIGVGLAAVIVYGWQV